jgi:SRSO17 transposase
VLRAEEWLLIEWPPGEAQPTKYFLCTLPEDLSFEQLVDTVKMRWRIERDYLELKQELGLSHYEGRNWRGFHHHASLCIAAYGFLMLERLSGFKKNATRLQAPALSEAFSPRGARSDATPHSVVDCNGTLPTGTRHRPKPSTMSVLR